MPAVPLPQFDRLVSGDSYNLPEPPTDDAADLSGAGANQIPNLPQGQPSPLTPVSIASYTMEAPSHGAFLMTNLHETNWLDPTKPHVSPETQKG